MLASLWAAALCRAFMEILRRCCRVDVFHKVMNRQNGFREACDRRDRRPELRALGKNRVVFGAVGQKRRVPGFSHHPSMNLSRAVKSMTEDEEQNSRRATLGRVESGDESLGSPGFETVAFAERPLGEISRHGPSSARGGATPWKPGSLLNAQSHAGSARLLGCSKTIQLLSAHVLMQYAKNRQTSTIATQAVVR